MGQNWVLGLLAIRYAEHPAIHRDRLRDAADPELHYLVAEREETIVGFGLLVCERPPTWPVDAITHPLPQIIDLYVPEALRSQGIGTSILCYMEQLAFNAGFDRLYLCVYPLDSPRAYDLYLRLGYQPLQAEPYHDHWRFTDSDDNVHEGEGWAIDMVKAVT